MAVVESESQWWHLEKNFAYPVSGSVEDGCFWNWLSYADSVQLGRTQRKLKYCPQHEVLHIHGFSRAAQKLLIRFFSCFVWREEGKICFGLKETLIWPPKNGVLGFWGSWPGLLGLQWNSDFKNWAKLRSHLDGNKGTRMSAVLRIFQSCEQCVCVYIYILAYFYCNWQHHFLGKEIVLSGWIMIIFITVFSCDGSSYGTCTRTRLLLLGL